MRQNLGGAGIRSTQDASVLGELLGGATDTALEVFKQGYPEDFELEADRMSVRHLVSAGYDPRALTWLLQRMMRESHGRDAYFRTHPPFKARLETVGTRLKALPAGTATDPAVLAVKPGTYREVVGPGIGDALATTRGRAYAF